MRARCAVASEGHVRVNVAYLQRTHVDAHVCIGELPSPEECMHGKICPFVDHRLYYIAVIAKLECAALHVHVSHQRFPTLLSSSRGFENISREMLRTVPFHPRRFFHSFFSFLTPNFYARRS